MHTEKNEAGFARRLLKGARDLVWEDLPPKTARAAAVPDEPSAETQPVSVPAKRAASPLSKELMDTVMSRPTAYSAFADAVAALADVPMDEATRYRSAFAILRKTQQRSVEQIAQAIDIHLGALESEAARFKGQSQSVEDEEIASRVKEAQALEEAARNGEAEIAALREQTESRVRALEQEIAGKRAQSAELAREAEQKRQTVRQVESDFAAAVESVKAGLGGERDKLRRFLA